MADVSLENHRTSRRSLYQRRPSLAELLAILTIMVAALTLVQVATQWTILPFWPVGQPNVTAAGGCMDLHVEEVDDEPPVSLSEVETEIRRIVESPGKAPGQLHHRDLPETLGNVRWAEFGYLAYPRPYNPDDYVPQRTAFPRWVLVFENPGEEGWFSRVGLGRSSSRFTAIYFPQEQEIEDACGGQSA